jgi:hypothetical protein
MDRHQDDAQVQEKACGALRNLAANDANQCDRSSWTTIQPSFPFEGRQWRSAAAMPHVQSTRVSQPPGGRSSLQLGSYGGDACGAQSGSELAGAGGGYPPAIRSGGAALGRSVSSGRVGYSGSSEGAFTSTVVSRPPGGFTSIRLGDDAPEYPSRRSSPALAGSGRVGYNGSSQGAFTSTVVSRPPGGFTSINLGSDLPEYPARRSSPSSASSGRVGYSGSSQGAFTSTVVTRPPGGFTSISLGSDLPEYPARHSSLVSANAGYGNAFPERRDSYGSHASSASQRESDDLYFQQRQQQQHQHQQQQHQQQQPQWQAHNKQSGSSSYAGPSYSHSHLKRQNEFSGAPAYSTSSSSIGNNHQESAYSSGSNSSSFTNGRDDSSAYCSNSIGSSDRGGLGYRDGLAASQYRGGESGSDAAYGSAYR